MRISEIEPGTKVKLKTRKGNFACRILESPSKEIILIKLNSGYNIGIKEEDILDLKVVKEKDDSSFRPSQFLDAVSCSSPVPLPSAQKGKKNNEIASLSQEKPNIALVVTGGTISSRLDVKTGGVKWLTKTDELLKFYPEILEIANVAKIEVPFMKASENMDAKDWGKISEVVVKLLNDSSISGVIVTHGTDFLHYTASALAFSLGKLNKPVVLTYSQRSSDRASSDANLNLICSARVAVSDIAEVVLVGHANSDDDFCYALPATKVRKMHTSRRDTFRPINSKPTAKVFSDKIEMIATYNVRDNKKKIKIKNKFSDKVALVKFYPGQSPDILDFYLKKGYKGLVIEVSGLGHLISEGKNSWIPKLKKLTKKMNVCASAQTIYGRLHPLVYSAGRELEKTEIIFLKDMLSETGFVKLSWILGDKEMRKEVKGNMLKNFAQEFNECLGEEEFLN